MKKLLALALALCMITGCALADTYVGAGKGNNGDIQVEVSFDGEKIESVTVKEHAETPGISDPALETIPGAIVEAQSVDVDAVAGATNTSNGIKLAVADAAAQAGIVLPGMAAGEAAKKESLTADVVVVGGGIAGMAAALTAAEQGAQVILVEKQAMLGGSGNLTAAGFYATETDKVPASVEDHEEMYNHILEMIDEGGDLENVEKDRIRHLVDEGPALVARLEGYGMEFATTDFQIKDAKQHYHLLADGSNGPGQVKILSEQLQKAGVNVLLNTKCIALNQSEGKMCGITAEQADGVFDINAGAVVIAAGGYAHNPDMIMRLQPETLFSYSCANAGATGEVLQMAANLGAAWYKHQYMLTCGFTSDPANPSLSMVCYPPYASMPLVDQTGKRFENEFLLWTLNSEMTKNVRNAPFYGIYDANFLKGTAAEFKYASIEEAIANGSNWVFKADTLDELAAMINVDAETFKETIARYNSVKGTSDPEPDFGVPNEQLSFVEEGPFYAVLMVSLNAGTMGGIKTQITGEVLDIHGEVIPGLYAAGESSNGGIYDRGYISGTSVLNCYIAGTDAGASAAAYAAAGK